MAKSSLTLGGIEEYIAAIENAGLDVLDAAEAAVVAGADVILDGMLRRVPIDEHNLESHLQTDPPEIDGDYVFVQVGLLHADADTARYGNAQEFGSSSMGAQPYVRPPFTEDKTKARRAMRLALKGFVDQ